MKFLGTVLLATLIFLSGCKTEPEPTPGDLPFLGIQNSSVTEGDENGIMSFEVRLSSASESDVTFNYSTESGSATGGEDFESVIGANFTIPAGETLGNIEITILGDDVVEGDEAFSVVVSGVVNAQISDNRANGNILNDDERVTTGTLGDEGYSTPESYSGYDLIWQEEFNDNVLSNDWVYEMGDGCPDICGWGNQELQYYTDRPENLYFQEGKLVIEARQESYNGSNYTSARIITKDKQEFQYGRIDIRAKLPFGQGLWPALWMLGSNIDQVGWPACGEIDIMELVGHESETVHGTCHWADVNGNRALFGDSYTLDSGIFWDEFHVFSILWDENQINWYVDDNLYHTINTGTSDLSEFRNSFFFILNIAVGGTWPGSPDATTTFPQKMAVDYIRVFQPQ